MQEKDDESEVPLLGTSAVWENILIRWHGEDWWKNDRQMIAMVGRRGYGKIDMRTGPYSIPLE